MKRSLLCLALLFGACDDGGGGAGGPAPDGGVSPDGGVPADGGLTPDGGPSPDGGDLLAPPPCGNGLLDEGEACDNGGVEGVGCDRFCRPEVCGDGIWHVGEACDDGNTNPGDGCSPDCAVEPGFGCVNAPRLSTGADAAGAARAVGETDLVWSWSEAEDGPRTIAALTDACPDEGRVEAPAGARWIGRGGCDADAPPDATTWYHAVFSVTPAARPEHTRLAGRLWAVDAVERVLLNGEDTGLAAGVGAAAGGDGLDLSAIPAGRLVAGPNRLSVAVRNGANGAGPNPDGLLVSIPEAYGAASRCATVGGCGNGHVEPGEACDDGNTVAGDGCAADCSGVETCGNGVVEPGEDCDAGDRTGGDGCSPFCHAEACGDGLLAWDEACDDANVAPGDGCAADCTIEPGMECLNAHPLATGSDGRGDLRHTGYADLVWTWSETPDGEARPAVVSHNCDPDLGGWASPTPEAQWITRAGCHVDVAPETVTYYRATFHVPTAAAAAATRLAGRLWADTDIVALTVNGREAPLNHLVFGDFNGGGHALSDIPPSFYREGENTIVVAVHNAAEAWGPNPGGLMVAVPEAYGIGSFCAAPIPCGDGAVGPGEVCDDGNRIDGDGCSSDCRSDETCGNAIHGPGEACDDGNDEAGDGCAPGCRSAEVCGDWVVDVEAGEVCDDGNRFDGDGCAADCDSDETCGNGVVDAFEECDDGGAEDGDGCSAVCHFEERCGNGRVSPGERCDDGNRESGDGCSADCGSDERCGNGIVDAHLGETCDDANDEDGDGCSGHCQPEACGNGVLEGAEDCDDGDRDDEDGCSADCEVEPGFRCVSAPNLNTGSDGRGGVRDVGQPDVRWTWSEGPDGERRPAVVSGNCAPALWTPAGDGAEWINRAGCAVDTPPETDTWYHATFTIPTWRQARVTVVDGRIWADNRIADVWVNGVATGFRTEGEAGFGGPGLSFGTWGSDLYVRGENTVSVVVRNAAGQGPNPDGLLVHVPAAFGAGSRCEAIP